MDTFELSIQYSQICVFDSSLENPFNNWSDRQVKQGFSWRPYSVSFKTLNESGNATIAYEVSTHSMGIGSETIRAIAVPFKVEIDMNIEVASITGSRQLPIPPGHYNLIFESSPMDENHEKIRFTFVRDGKNSPRIICQDAGLSPESPFDMQGMPAP